MPGKLWDYTPENCLRISDHWNFKRKGQAGPVHCPTDRPAKEGWALGKWDGEKFVILKEFGLRRPKTTSWIDFESPK